MRNSKSIGVRGTCLSLSLLALGLAGAMTIVLPAAASSQPSALQSTSQSNSQSTQSTTETKQTPDGGQATTTTKTTTKSDGTTTTQTNTTETHPANGSAKKPPSPAAHANAVLNGHAVSVDYSAPSARGRAVMGALVPYGQVWRTGANAATTLKSDGNLKIGSAIVPAGTYTLYSLPGETVWHLIINKETGQWGTEYSESDDLARVVMDKSVQAMAPQETFSISFENTNGASTEMHLRWEKTDVFVPVTATE